jgi:threonine aldolase
LAFHLDGARLFNALVETHENPTDFGQAFDSISICLSKGLGTPMGSILLGTKEFIKQARRIRKRLGGGWRQSGYLAAAGIYALDHNINRLKEDHQRAKELATIFATLPEVINILPVDTNIVIFEMDHQFLATDFVAKLNNHGIKTSPFGKHQIRLVSHLDFGDLELEACREIIEKMK